MDINFITVSGRVDNPPMSSKKSNTLYVNFILAVNSNPAAKTQYYAISASGKNAETIINSVNVGDRMFILGKPGVDTYMGKDKQIIAVQKIWIDKFEFCSNAELSAETPVGQEQGESIVTSIDAAIDDFKTEANF